MAQVFSNIESLKNYINTNVIPNDRKLISGEKENNIENSLADFIVSYGVNTTRGDVSSNAGIILLTKPVTLFTGTLPTAIQWNDNVQNQYYIINTLGVPIPLTTGYSYLDEALVERTSIPALSVVQIMKIENGSWVKVNTSSDSGGIDIPNNTANPAIELSGTLNRVIDFKVSDDSGNAAEIRSDGLFVTPGSGSGGVTQIDF